MDSYRVDKKESERTKTKRGFAVLMSGTVTGQIVVFASSPLLTRIYDPNAFALLAVVTAISSILAVVLAFKLEMLIPLVKEEESARRLVSAGISTAAILGLFISGVMLAAGPFAEKTFGIDGLAKWLWIAPVVAAAGTAFQILNQWAIRLGEFKSLATNSVIRPVVMTAVQIIIGLAGVKLGGLSIGLAAGHIVSAGTMFARSGARIFRLAGTIDCLRVETRNYKQFLAVLSVAGLLNVAATQFPVLLFSLSYSSEATGQLSLTQKILAAPVAIVGVAMSQVFVNLLATAVRNSRPASSIFVRVTTINMAAALVGGGVILLWGQTIFGFVFGSEWQQAGQFAQFLTIGMVAQLIAAPVSQSLAVLRWSRSQLVCDGVRFLACGGVLIIIPQLSDWPGAAVIGLGMAMAAGYLLQWLVVLIAIRSHDRGLQISSVNRIEREAS